MMMNKKEYIDLQIVKYHSFESDLPRWKEGQKRFLEDFFEVHTDAKILDVACGDGVGLSWFKDNGYTSVMGFDASERKAERARVYGYPVGVGDMHQLPYETGQFDVVYSSHTLEHALSPATVLDEFYRILKPEGILIVVLPYPDGGPDDAHVGKYILKTDTKSADEEGSLGVINFLSSRGFCCNRVKEDDFREPEIWLRLSKYLAP